MGVFDVLARGMQANEQMLHYQSLNIANMQTPGYLRTQANFSSLLKEGLNERSLTYDKSSGPFVATGRPLDLYLQPSIYMQVRDESGVAYSRFGRLEINKDGELLDGNGKPLDVVGAFSASDISKARIDEQGGIWVGEEKKGAIALVKIDNATVIKEGYVREAEGISQSINSNALLSGGYEMSNVNFSDEVVDLMLSIRYMNGLQFAYKSIDGLYQKAISDLGRF
ncbi:flagellar basal body protein [Chitiniphilus shinanonensis]|uniref:Flagellar basal body protein n=1 Tax=Chitiniphilus shinanonensis TaxID=553088 RepID=A0ABQ6BT76_9NEIS|nr:flagellar hook-basal body complex protein [Chitiniphilus shinanonensis]GLS04400.1 flagellar basal body protein [Chitiniphilus shinanonensis]